MTIEILSKTDETISTVEHGVIEEIREFRHYLAKPGGRELIKKTPIITIQFDQRKYPIEMYFNREDYLKMFKVGQRIVCVKYTWKEVCYDSDNDHDPWTPSIYEDKDWRLEIYDEQLYNKMQSSNTKSKQLTKTK